MTGAPGHLAANDDSEAGYGIVPRYLRGRLTSHEIAVYVALSWRTNENGICWLRHSRLAEEAGCSVSTTQRALNSLRDKGLVAWLPRLGSSGEVICNTYRLRIYADGVPPRSHRRDPSVTPTDTPGQNDRQNENPGTNHLEAAVTTSRGHRGAATDRLDAIADVVNGFFGTEERTAEAMLEEGYPVRAVVNKIEADRR